MAFRFLSRRTGLSVSLPGFTVVLLLAAATLGAADAPRVPLDVLLRLKNTNLEANPTLRTALLRALEENQGTPQFLELVRAFNLRDQAPGLIRLAAARPDESAGAEALQRVLDDGGGELLRQALAGSDAAGLIRALGNISDDAGPALLKPIATDPARDPALRLAAVRSLAQSGPGAPVLLELARAGSLPADAKAAAATALAANPVPGIREDAATILPPAAKSDSSEALAAILTRQGDAVRGGQIYHGAAGCFACHRAEGRGGDVGPDLSTIGDKYAKPAMYANIVDPGAGIVFGYEAWMFELRNGAAAGMIASETDDEIAVRSVSGITVRHRKEDVVRRTPLGTSLMPAGLLSSLDNQGIADLLEYLARLKKSP